MKIALCFSGQMRDYYNYSDKIFEKIIDKYDVDVFLHSWNQEKEKTEDLLNTYKPILYLIEDFSPEKVIYSKKWLDENNRRIESNIGQGDYNKRFLSTPQNIFSMYYSIYKSNELKIKYELDNDFKYDIVFRCRLDLEFLFDFDIKDEGYIVSPYTICHYGVADHWAYGPSDLMDKYSDVWRNIAPNIENDNYPKGMNMPHQGMCAETILNYHIKKNNIPFKQRKYEYLLRGKPIY